jgi:hypothetical protein
MGFSDSLGFPENGQKRFFFFGGAGVVVLSVLIKLGFGLALRPSGSSF